MEMLNLTDKNGREYHVNMTPISVLSHYKDKDMRDDSCILVVAKKTEEGFEVIGLHCFSPALQHTRHFSTWDTEDDKYKWAHVERQIGATHYGVVTFQYDHDAKYQIEALKEVVPHRLSFCW